MRFKDAGDDAPSQREISHVLVRLSLQGTLTQFNATFLTHATSQINALKNSLRTMNTTRWHKERKENLRSTGTPCLTSTLSKETGQLNKTQWISFVRVPSPSFNSQSKGGACPPFDLLSYTQNKEAHKRKEGTPSFRRRHKMFKR